MPDEDPKPNREEFAEARRALVDRIVADHPGLSHTDFNDIKIADFDSHASTLAEARVAADREAGARALGISVEDFDKLKTPKEESTPESRTANLPSGRTTPPPAKSQNASDDGASGIDLMEQAARDFLSESGYLTK